MVIRKCGIAFQKQSPDHHQISQYTVGSTAITSVSPDHVGISQYTVGSTAIASVSPDHIRISQYTVGSTAITSVSPDHVGISQYTVGSTAIASVSPDHVGISQYTVGSTAIVSVSPDHVGISQYTVGSTAIASVSPDHVGISQYTVGSTAIASVSPDHIRISQYTVGWLGLQPAIHSVSSLHGYPAIELSSSIDPPSVWHRSRSPSAIRSRQYHISPWRGSFQAQYPILPSVHQNRLIAYAVAHRSHPNRTQYPIGVDQIRASNPTQARDHCISILTTADNSRRLPSDQIGQRRSKPTNLRSLRDSDRPSSQRSLVPDLSLLSDRVAVNGQPSGLYLRPRSAFPDLQYDPWLSPQGSKQSPDHHQISQYTVGSTAITSVSPDHVGISQYTVGSTAIASVSPDHIRISQYTVGSTAITSVSPDHVGISQYTVGSTAIASVSPDHVGISQYTVGSTAIVSVSPDHVGISQYTVGSTAIASVSPDHVGISQYTVGSTAIASVSPDHIRISQYTVGWLGLQPAIHSVSSLHGYPAIELSSSSTSLSPFKTDPSRLGAMP
ncbi:mucin-1-like [Brassica napus]|uniref:mucin-1-like n=1 Tax=Brassica napus TaxID=3708 RepID=UPI00207AC159|nr:mucin-1-like [Brassica napus]